MVKDDGEIKIDWSDCYENSVDEKGTMLSPDPDEDGSGVLDAWVAEHPEFTGIVQKGKS